MKELGKSYLIADFEKFIAHHKKPLNWDPLKFCISKIFLGFLQLTNRLRKTRACLVVAERTSDINVSVSWNQPSANSVYSVSKAVKLWYEASLKLRQKNTAKIIHVTEEINWKTDRETA